MTFFSRVESKVSAIGTQVSSSVSTLSTGISTNIAMASDAITKFNPTDVLNPLVRQLGTIPTLPASSIPGAPPVVSLDLGTGESTVVDPVEAAETAAKTPSAISFKNLASLTNTSVVATATSGITQLSNNIFAQSAALAADNLSLSDQLGSMSELSKMTTGLDALGNQAKDGSFSLSDITKAPRNLVEGLKDNLLGGVSSLKSSFNTLPNFMQKSLMGDTGLIGSYAKNMMPGQAVVGRYAGFFNKVTSGDYILNPKSFKRDVGSLTSFTKGAMKNGIFDGIVTMGLRLSSNQNIFTQVATRTAMGLLVSKNKKALLKMGVNIGNHPDLLSLSGGKTKMVRTLFSTLALPKVKAKDYRSIFIQSKTAARALDSSSIGTGSRVNASAFREPSNFMKSIFGSISSDKNVGRTASALNAVAAPTDDDLMCTASYGTVKVQDNYIPPDP